MSASAMQSPHYKVFLHLTFDFNDQSSQCPFLCIEDVPYLVLKIVVPKRNLKLLSLIKENDKKDWNEMNLCTCGKDMSLGTQQIYL
jgi:hypothetical protein